MLDLTYVQEKVPSSKFEIVPNGSPQTDEVTTATSWTKKSEGSFMEVSSRKNK